MVSGLILLGLSAFFWFYLAKDATAKSATGFIRVLKAVVGVKGYVILAKALAIFMFIAAISEFYKHFAN